MGSTTLEIARTGGRGRSGWLVGAVLTAWLLTGASAASLGATTSVSVTQGSLRLTPSAGPRVGSPLTITETGQVGLTSTLEVFAQLGRPCAGAPGQAAGVGALRIDQRVIGGSSAPFDVTSTFTPTTAGSYFVCGYLDGASGGSQVSETASIVVVVAPASPPPAGTPPAGPAANPGPAGIGSPSRTCVVPGLSRHSLAGARRLLGVAGCRLGVVLQPSARSVLKARRRPGGRSLVLVVGSQFPASGTKLRADQYVAIRLVVGRPPGSRSTRRTK